MAETEQSFGRWAASTVEYQRVSCYNKLLPTNMFRWLSSKWRPSTHDSSTHGGRFLALVNL